VYEEKVVAFSSERYLQEASNYYTKLEVNYPFLLLDEDSYDRLYNRFLELRTDKAIDSMQEDNESDAEEEDISLTDFLRTSSDILTSEESAPIIKFVNALFYQAVKKRASDIHIEVQEKKGEVRFRIDGMLSKNADLDKKVVSLIVSRIKVISNLDISEKRIPQDGRTQIKIAGEVLDIRVSILPTFYGERVVMRVLMQSSQIPQINELGFNKELIDDVQKLLRSSHGIILVTGPTGSGKTTSLHSFLREVEAPHKNLITVEDPVEYNAHNINQVQANTKVNLTFAVALRSILRQDPDIVMIGEIRDEETANIAIQASLTGHLVLSTLHTNTSTGAITRLADMGVNDYLISSSVIGVLSQRLVRKLCIHCKKKDNTKVKYSFNPKNKTLYKAVGCDKCFSTGYSGRVAIGELFIIDDDVKELIRQTQDEHKIREFMKTKGLVTIQDRLATLMKAGTTSVEEAIRIGIY
jgi:general secretion pathway protein E